MVWGGGILYLEGRQDLEPLKGKAAGARKGGESGNVAKGGSTHPSRFKEGEDMKIVRARGGEFLLSEGESDHYIKLRARGRNAKRRCSSRCRESNHCKEQTGIQERIEFRFGRGTHWDTTISFPREMRSTNKTKGAEFSKS